MLVTSCPKKAAVTPGITSLHNPGEEPAGEKKEKIFPEVPLVKTRLHDHPVAARESGKANKLAREKRIEKDYWGAKQSLLQTATY